jgi:peptidoglycan/LPS O-acetylase OafA/YrhL
MAAHRGVGLCKGLSAPVLYSALAVAVVGVFCGAVTKIGVFYLPALAVCIPMVFTLSKSSRIDSAVGELSYPIYLAHLPIMAFVTGTHFWGTVLVSVAASGVLIAATKPIDRLRGIIRKGRPIDIHLHAQSAETAKAAGASPRW